MIHVASLIHDDVIDEADMRRGGSAVHTLYTNKVAVLAGDYLLARASRLLARLRNADVVETMASALDELVQGEIMQARCKGRDLLDMKQYLRKSYYKTGSLICQSCKSVALLAGYGLQDNLTLALEQYGFHLGLAYQIVDDILDYTGASSLLGKPTQSDMKLGLVTAPMLFAAEENPALQPLILRKFERAGDIDQALQLASNTNCVVKSYELAEYQIRCAQEALMVLPHSVERDALEKLLYLVISRNK